MGTTGSRSKSAKDRQLATILDPEHFAVVERMSANLGMSRAEVARQLIQQGIAALRAAAAAADDGRRDLDAAAIAALQLAAVEAEVTRLHLDALGGHLDAVVQRNWRDAVLMAAGAAEALSKWAEEQAQAHGVTVDELMGNLVAGVH